MELSEIAEFASGKPGEVMPPCPDAATVTKLKDAGIGFGPCDPLSEDGQVLRVPRGAEHDPDLAEASCGELIIDGASSMSVSLPCAPGAKIYGVVGPGRSAPECAQIRYVVRQGEAERTDEICPGQTLESGLSARSM